MGRAYGEAADEQIATAMAFFEKVASTHDSHLSDVEPAMGPFIDSARSHLPILVDEMEGIGEGSGAGFEAIALLNCLEEIWPFDSCTTVVTGRYLAHAEQWLAGHGGVTLIEARPDDGPAFVAPSSPGCLAATGMNASGFAQGIDSLQRDDDRTGVPRTFVARLALGATSVDRAIEAASIENRAGGYAHVLASATRRVVVETSATGVVELEGMRAHTNHYLSEPPPETSKEGSQSRLHRARELLQQADDDLDSCMALLSDHEGDPQSICLHEQGLQGDTTVFGMVCDLHTGVVTFSDGPPCEGRWHEATVPGFRRIAGVV
jgi:isopenicillin-N N-acyltransferase like protein